MEDGQTKVECELCEINSWFSKLRSLPSIYLSCNDSHLGFQLTKKT